MFELCPDCGGQLQIFTFTDADDKMVGQTVKCRRKYPNKKKKGCGYMINLQKVEWIKQ